MQNTNKRQAMRVVVPGHIYELPNLGSGTQVITFVRRSGGAVTYGDEWPGLQTQTVLRALIDRTRHLNEILPCVETQNALWHLRSALFEYEVRAWRRKQEKVNRTAEEHGKIERPRIWRNYPYSDVPFGIDDIETLPVGADGHVIVS